MNNSVKYLTVTALNRYISYKFETDQHLKKLYVKGEISNIRLSKGFLYFNLKDENSEISAVMFANAVNRLKFTPIDGMTVLVEASVTLYQKKGTYNLNIDTMTEVGLGEAYLNFLKLRDKLQKEGLFDDKYKLPIPNYLENIAVITSGTGDALHDIVSTIDKRFPLAKIYLYPALVQGESAPKDLIRALKQAYQNKEIECIIIGRGGGSIEDLSCFNDEQLARTIFSSKIPIISAVGHEADYTICDYVASFRAPTPTGAAVKATNIDKYEILSKIDNIEKHLKLQIKKAITTCEHEYISITKNYYFANFLDVLNRKEKDLDNIVYNLKMLSPLNLINSHSERLINLNKRLSLLNINRQILKLEDNVNTNVSALYKYTNRIIDNAIISVDNCINRLIVVNPLNLMKKGYTLTYQNDKLIASINDLDSKKELNVKFYDGEIVADIKSIRRK